MIKRPNLLILLIFDFTNFVKVLDLNVPRIINADQENMMKNMDLF